MTTLSQADLPQDTGVLKTAANYNEAKVGVYATVVQTGTVRIGDTLSVL
jgi:MOSC domain-containing protein YiiM